MAPESIVDHRVRAALEFRWADGTRQVAAYWLLRANCPCADCKSLSTASGEKATVGLRSDDGIQLTDILPVGAYGVQFVFSDGHDRGIFPWVFLKALLERKQTSVLASQEDCVPVCSMGAAQPATHDREISPGSATGVWHPDHGNHWSRLSARDLSCSCWMN